MFRLRRLPAFRMFPFVYELNRPCLYTLRLQPSLGSQKIDGRPFFCPYSDNQKNVIEMGYTVIFLTVL
ncbi:hypothetical protein ASL11_12145 [Paenibacillus sp. Soil750]|nr:hypothetical protein ASL11_12145 [Paenibacillus sp. Soil750]